MRGLPSTPRQERGLPSTPLNAVHLGWHSRGYLPHFDQANLIQSVNFRLADSLPQRKLVELQQGLTRAQQAERQRRIEAWLDSGAGSCVLRRPDCAAIMQEELLLSDMRRYRLLAWCVMANHVHMLLAVLPGQPLHKALQALKACSARRINALLGRTGTLWQPEYYDRMIRNEAHYASELEYIEYNPVTAGLCARPENWPWTSAGWRRGDRAPRGY